LIGHQLQLNKGRGSARRRTGRPRYLEGQLCRTMAFSHLHPPLACSDDANAHPQDASCATFDHYINSVASSRRLLDDEVSWSIESVHPD